MACLGRRFILLVSLGLAGIVQSGFARAQTILPEIAYTGTLRGKVEFEDRLGKHVIVTSQLKNARGSERGGGEFIFAYDYMVRTGGYALNWKLEDGVKECQLDYFTDFAAPPVITDLDGNGVKEVTLVYGLACRGGIDASEYKVILREDQKKYALRGLDLVPVSEDSIPPENPCCGDGDGKYSSERDFKGAPAAFLKHARQLWMKYRSHFWEKGD